MKNLLAKLLKVQQEIGAIAKDSTNPFFKSKYFDINGLIAEVKPMINKHGLVIMQPLTMLDGKPAIQTIIADPETGEQFESTTLLPENNDPQKFGSGITYYRRYALQSILFLQAEDDDANSVSGEHVTKPKTEYKDDGKPWLNEEQYQGMLKWIAEGKGEEVRERMKNYKMKTTYRDVLTSSLQKGATPEQVPVIVRSDEDSVSLSDLPF
jgi:hypothetical protein